MKKKIVFVTKRMIMGGIEKSLISLIENLPTNEFDVTILVMEPGGELLDQIPREVTVKHLFGSEKTALRRIWKYAKNGKYTLAFKTGFYTLLLKRGPKSGYEENMYYSKMLPIENTKYDLAIAYYIPTSFPVVYVMKNINAKKKAAWIHGDVTKYGRSLPKYKEFYERYDNIFGVSNYTVEKFREMFLDLKGKTSVFYNILDKRKMELFAANDDSYGDHFEGFRILTVGRLETEKGQDLIPKVLSRLLSEGYHIRWYCIGDGEMRSQLENLIKEYHLEENLILLGTKDNPYPFIKDCDLYIQPSRHEAYCITVAEARMFKKPIITTNTGASEQIIHDKSGLIVDFDEYQMFEAIIQLLNNKVLRDKFIKNLSMETVDTTKEIEKLYQITERIRG